LAAATPRAQATYKIRKDISARFCVPNSLIQAHKAKNLPLDFATSHSPTIPTFTESEVVRLTQLGQVLSGDFKNLCPHSILEQSECPLGRDCKLRQVCLDYNAAKGCQSESCDKPHVLKNCPQEVKSCTQQMPDRTCPISTMATSGIIPEDLKKTVDSHMKAHIHKDPLKDAGELEELANRVVLVGLLPAHLALHYMGPKEDK